VEGEKVILIGITQASPVCHFGRGLWEDGRLGPGERRHTQSSVDVRAGHVDKRVASRVNARTFH
jgi:hypothetical protein